MERLDCVGLRARGCLWSLGTASSDPARGISRSINQVREALQQRESVVCELFLRCLAGSVRSLARAFVQHVV